MGVPLVLLLFEGQSEPDGFLGEMIPFGFQFFEAGKLDGRFNIGVLFFEILDFLPESPDYIPNGVVVGFEFLPVVIETAAGFGRRTFALN